MIEIGEVQKLKVKRSTSVGLFLGFDDESRKEDDVLLPIKEVPEGVKVGDEVEVFISRDSEDRLIATTTMPMLKVGDVGSLKVIDITNIGAFLDWGLDKDLFLPFKEQTMKLKKGNKYLVGVYIDKSDRICATMKVKDFLKEDSPYKENDWVKGTIYSINDEIGAFVAVDNKYHGLLPKKEMIRKFFLGEEVEFRVTKVKEDGKLDLSLRDKSYIQIEKDVETILKKLRDNGGELPLNDYSSPKEIKEMLNMSKSAFKKSIGRLLKEGKIEFTNDGIKLWLK